MTTKRIITGSIAREAIQRIIGAAPEGSVVVIREGDRTAEQNSAQWPILDAFSKQLEWPVNGQMSRLGPEEWKDILTAAFSKGEKQRVAPGIDGGFVLLGLRTSRMGKKEFSDWLEFLNATAIDRGVVL